MFWRLEDRIVKLEVFTQNVAWRMGPWEVKEALGPMNLCRVLFALQTLDRERSRKISKSKSKSELQTRLDTSKIDLQSKGWAGARVNSLKRPAIKIPGPAAIHFKIFRG
jgi:hypothetical protein